MRRPRDKADLRGALVIHAIKAWPGAVRWQSLLEEADIAWADKRTAEGQLRSLLSAGILTLEENGSGRTVRATETAAKAVYYALRKEMPV